MDIKKNNIGLLSLLKFIFAWIVAFHHIAADLALPIFRGGTMLFCFILLPPVFFYAKRLIKREIHLA